MEKDYHLYLSDLADVVWCDVCEAYVSREDIVDVKPENAGGYENICQAHLDKMPEA